MLHIFNGRPEDYSPAGDGGFALFATGLQAIAFARELGRRAASRGITLRAGINHGEVAFAKRGPVGPGVLRADEISSQAPPNGIAVLADVWRNLDRTSQDDWQTSEIASDVLALEAKPAVPVRASTTPLTARDLNLLAKALSDIPQFGSVQERRTFIRMALAEYPLGGEADKTLRFLDWQGAPLADDCGQIRM